MIKAILALYTALIAISFSGDFTVKYGAELPKSTEGLGGTKALFVSHQSRTFGPFIKQFEGGLWVDNVGGGRKSAVIGSGSLGIEVNTGYVFAQALTGPALISASDSLLGGPLQFNNDVAIGLRDPKTRNTFGFAYKHISSAGIYEPNRGRDFIMFRVGIGL